ncbi:subunit of the Arp2/3 complex [Basidiobolus ranarum]|uniref:Actin-related protein 2/3 complex subunit 3 n=1 Tax=Basidiobolus ranarum TaxID=34480 RepID=A0ABR2VZF7_9FUNG
MPAYHSNLNESEFRSLGNMAMLPIRTKFRGPAPSLADPNSEDIVEEALNLFRANSFFRNFEIKGNADRVLIYLILYISDCLGKLTNQPSKLEANKILQTSALSHFALPGEPSFPLNAMYHAPADRGEQDLLRQYLTQLRQELATRLLERIYGNENVPSKWWMCFLKRKFMGKSL